MVLPDRICENLTNWTIPNWKQNECGTIVFVMLNYFVVTFKINFMPKSGDQKTPTFVFYIHGSQI